MMPYEFRLLKPSELPTLFLLYQSAIRRMCEQGIDQWDELYPDYGTLLLDIQKKEMYGLFDRGRLVASVVLNEEEDEEYKGVAWRLRFDRVGVNHRLCVDAAQQGRGYARKIAMLAEQEFRRRGYECIRLDAFPQNPAAIRLYTGLGYCPCGSIRLRKGIFTCFEKALTDGQIGEQERKTAYAE